MTGVKGIGSQALGLWAGVFALSWNIGSILILASWKKAFSNMGKGGGANRPGKGSALSCAAPTAVYPMCKKQERGAVWPRVMASSTVLSAQSGGGQKAQQPW